MKLLAAITVLVLALLMVLLPLVFREPQADSTGESFHTEVVPFELSVDVTPVGKVEREDLDEVAGAIESAFRIRAKVQGAMSLPEAALNESRGQYNADWIIRVAEVLRSERAFRTFLVTAADMYAGENSCVLSHSSSDGKLALLSTARLGGTERIEMPLEHIRKRLRLLAIRAFAASLGIRPCDSECALTAGGNLEDIESLPEYFCPICARALQDLLETGIGSPQGHFRAAMLYLEDGSLDGAIEELKKAIELKRNYLAAYLNLGELYMKKGWHAEAIAVFRKAATAVPASIEPHTRLAQVLLLNDQAGAAVEELQTALALDPDSREVNRLMGIAYQFYMKDAGKARAHYRRYIELGGDSPEIKDLLRYLEGAANPEGRGNGEEGK